jgi:hypothetical protein
MRTLGYAGKRTVSAGRIPPTWTRSRISWRVSDISASHADRIREIDLNPVIGSGVPWYVADASVRLA